MSIDLQGLGRIGLRIETKLIILGRLLYRSRLSCRCRRHRRSSCHYRCLCSHNRNRTFIFPVSLFYMPGIPGAFSIIFSETVAVLGG